MFDFQITWSKKISSHYWRLTFESKWQVVFKKDNTDTWHTFAVRDLEKEDDR